MFGTPVAEIELSGPEVLSGEREDQLAFEATLDALAHAETTPDRHELPPLEDIPVGPYLATLLEHYDPTQLNGHDVMRLLKARERQSAHTQARCMYDAVESSYSAAGGRDSAVERIDEQFEYAADEIRAALTLTRRAAEYRLSFATDLIERLPMVWRLLDEGLIDVARARVFSDGTAHLSKDTAERIVDLLADVAPRLTTGQLRYRISKLCMSLDPEDAEERERHARGERKVVIEPTTDGTADIHLLDFAIADARAIGRRINAHMISLKKEDRSGRTHDQLRADIARDLLLGGDATSNGRGIVDIRVPASTLDGGSEPGEILGVGPVTADTARKLVQTSPNAEHILTLVDDHSRPTHIRTLSRHATKTIRRHIETLQPHCAFPGCMAPAGDCDYDHLLPWSAGGETSTLNGGPKCDHDHELKDQGWSHSRQRGQDKWISRLGHVYHTEPP